MVTSTTELATDVCSREAIHAAKWTARASAEAMHQRNWDMLRERRPWWSFAMARGSVTRLAKLSL